MYEYHVAIVTERGSRGNEYTLELTKPMIIAKVKVQSCARGLCHFYQIPEIFKVTEDTPILKNTGQYLCADICSASLSQSFGNYSLQKYTHLLSQTNIVRMFLFGYKMLSLSLKGRSIPVTGRGGL
jgi:hypothetical protein